MLSQNNKIKKQLEKRLSIEDLESRQLLSAAPLSMETDFVVASTLTTSNDLLVDFSPSFTEDAPAALQAEGQGESPIVLEKLESATGLLNLTAQGNKIYAQYQTEPGNYFTLALLGFDNAGTGKDVCTFKTIYGTPKNVVNGIYSQTYTGKPNYTYNVIVITGTFTAKDFADNGESIPNNRIKDYDAVTILPTPEIVAKPGSATIDSITFQQKNGQPIQDLENLRFTAKFDGDRAATEYIVSGNQLVSEQGVSPYTIVKNNDGSVTITGLQQNAKQTFQVAQVSGNSVSAYSRNLTISTTRDQMPVPTNVVAANNGKDAVVGWKGEIGTTYTVAYSYTNAAGKTVSKTVSTKATVNGNLDGSLAVSNLLPNTKYTFKVSANKTTDRDASVFVESNTITTPTVIPAPVLKNVGSTESTVTLQVSNWNKMGAALQEVNANGEGGTFTVKNGTTELASFVYKNGAWENTTAGSTSAMNYVDPNNQNVIEVTIAGLNPNTVYSLHATASSDVVNNNINTVTLATSKAINVKTDIAAYNPVTNVTAQNITASSMEVSWTPSAPQSKFIVTAVPSTSYGKTITQTVSDSKATITGLEPNTDYVVNVVVKAGKNGKQSDAASTTAKTLENFDLRNVTELQENHYSLDFGVDMTKYSGRLDFTVAGSGKVYAPLTNGGTEWKSYADSFPATSCSLFFGADAQNMANEYLLDHPNANILILENNNVVNDKLRVTTVKTQYDFDITWNFVSTATGANLDLSFSTAQNVMFDFNSTAKLTDGMIKDNANPANQYSAKIDKVLSFHFNN